MYMYTKEGLTLIKRLSTLNKLLNILLPLICNLVDIENFKVYFFVTQFELALHQVGPMVYAGPIFYSADADRDLMHTFRSWSENAPDEITAVVNLTTAPPLPVIPAEWHGKKVAAIIAVSAGPLETGDSLVSEFRDVAEPIADLLGPMPYNVIQTLIDPLWGKGINSYFKATNLSRLDDELIDRLADLHLAAPGPQCEIHVHQMGGAVARVADDATAFAERSMPFLLNAVTGWHDPAVGDAHRTWSRAVVDAALPGRPLIKRAPRSRIMSFFFNEPIRSPCPRNDPTAGT